MRTVAADDDVVVERDADDISRLAETLRLDDVLFRRRRIAAWMVVRNYHRHRTQPNRMTENVARMEKSLVRSATRDSHGFAKKMPL